VSASRDTIAAIATPAGRGGIGVLRLSGPEALAIAEAIAGRALEARRAILARFRDGEGETIDRGLAIAFPAPASYTGEDVAELHGHGSPILLQRLLARCLQLGARMARPGEFSERAFLEGKLDLAQAEAVADLIAAGSEAAARAALRSLDGVFSQRVEALGRALVELRVYVEAALDFPEEEIDFLSEGRVAEKVAAVRADLGRLRQEAARGARLRDGLHVVLLGRPNAGKSSLLNALAGEARAIVTEIPGTTRDLLREPIDIGGVAITVVDTAGLREAGDAVEEEGIRRARREAARADLALIVLDAASGDRIETLSPEVPEGIPRIFIHNKIDLLPDPERGPNGEAPEPGIRLSARTGEGLGELRELLRRHAGLGESTEGAFTARQRHLDALARAAAHVDAAAAQAAHGQGELLAEELRLAHAALGEITGAMNADALLGEIFASFCIGK
jgi:tRNA modification GTPase